MIDPRLAWFAIGALFSAVLFGWHWHPRFSRYRRRGGIIGTQPLIFNEGHTQRGNGSGGPTTAKPPIKPQPSGGRMIDQSGMTIGYQPLPRSGRTVPPPQKP